MNSVSTGRPAGISDRRVRAKCKEEKGSAGHAVAVTSREIALISTLGEIRVDQQRPLATARSFRENELHQIIMGVQLRARANEWWVFC